MNSKSVLSYIVYLLPLGAVACFILVPLLSLILEGFRSSDGSITFTEFLDVLGDERSMNIILFTMEQALISTIATIFTAVPGAYLLSRYRFPGRSVLLSLTTVPFILPPLVLAIGFFTLFGTSGHINSLISHFEVFSGLELPAIDILYSIKGIVLAHVFLNFPVALRLIYSRFEHLDPNLEKASRSLGSGPLMTFFRVMLPQMKYTLIASISLVFTFCFLSFGVILVIGGGANQTMETEIYRQFSGMLDFPRAGIFLFIETVIVAISTGIYVWASGRSEIDLGYGPSIGKSSKRPGRMGKAGLIISIIYTIFVVTIIIGPLLSVVWESMIMDGSISFHFFDQVISSELDPSIGISPLEAVLNSLIFAFLSSIISIPVSIGMGYLLHRKGGFVKLPIDVLLLMPIGISAVGLGFGLINAYSGTVWDPTGTWYVIVIVHVMLSYPFGARVIHSALSSIPGNLAKASRSLGAGPIRTFFSVELPLLSPSIIVAALFSFAISIGEFGATLMVSATTKYLTMPVALYRFLGSGRQYGAATAYASIMILITFLCFLMMELAGKRIQKRSDA